MQTAVLPTGSTHSLSMGNVIETGTDEFFGVGLEVPVFSRWRIQGDFSRYRIDRETIELIGIGVSFRIR